MKLFWLIILLFSINTFGNELPSWFGGQKEIASYEKVIVINDVQGRLKAYYHWVQIYDFPVSTGDKNYPTPRWKFRIVNKHPMMQSRINSLWMPNWMEFYWWWQYWIHALPLFPDKTPKYPDSAVNEKKPWWCARLLPEDAQKLYNWTEKNTKVIIY